MTRTLIASIVTLATSCGPIEYPANKPPLPTRAVEKRALTEPEKRAASLADPNAKHCGFVGLHEDPWPTINCTVGHFKRSRPFYAVFQRQGIDSFVAEGIVGGRDGTIRLMVYDSLGNWSKARPCIQPSLDAILGREYIQCSGTGYLHHNAWTYARDNTTR